MIRLQCNKSLRQRLGPEPKDPEPRAPAEGTP